MTGKIFAESENIYQDEAKVLFEYYKAAAEKIVSEEMDLENKITQAQNELVEATSKKNSAFIMAIVGIICLVAGILLLFLKSQKYLPVLSSLLVPYFSL